MLQDNNHSCEMYVFGMRFFRMKKYDEAIKSFNKVEKGSLFYSEARFFQGHAAQILGKYNEAIATWKEVQKDNPLYLETQFLIDCLLSMEYILQDNEMQNFLSTIGQELLCTNDIELIGME